jgi:signal peptide peptidase SppA
MPLPSPKSKEKKKDWESRCMADEEMNREFPDREQRFAVCSQKWRDRNKKKSAASDLTLLDGSAWGILPGYLNGIVARINAVESGDIEISAFFGFGELAETYMTVNADGIAVINIGGVIKHSVGLFDRLFGDATDSGVLLKDIKKAMTEQTIRGVFMHIDSPGGMVKGSREIMEAIRELNEVKPVVAFTDGNLASAAYWIASAADSIYAYTMAEIGSLGVVAMHIDRSILDKRIGITRTFITKGAFKRIAGDNQPLSDEARDYLQGIVNEVATVMFDDIAANRDIDVNSIDAQEARLYMAAAAKGEGLIDGVANFNQAYNKLRRRLKIMDYQELKTNFPDVAKKAHDDGLVMATKADIENKHPDKVDDWKKEGAQTERARISEINDAMFPGQEALADEMIKDGTSADDARKRFIADHKGNQAKSLEDLKKDDPGDTGGGSGEDYGAEIAKQKTVEDAPESPGEAGNVLDAAAKDIVKRDGINYAEAFKKACVELPKAAEVYNG